MEHCFITQFCQKVQPSRSILRQYGRFKKGYSHNMEIHYICFYFLVH